MRTKRITAVFLAVIMLFALCACGKNSGGDIISAAETAAYLTEKVPPPVTGSVGGEWLILGLVRSGAKLPEGYIDCYYEQVEKTVADCGGMLSEKKYTEYSRLVIALTAIGKDPANIAGYDLLAPLGFYEQTVFQGINGAVYALLALDCGGYDVPQYSGEGTQATREMYVDFLLSKELPDGGWSFAGGTAEADMTGMVLQALSNYTDRQDVSDAVKRGLEVISKLQTSNGGFSEDNTDSCEAVAQVITALCELGIDISDKRFVKDGNSLADRLMDFALENGGFAHAADEKEFNQMATEQALYALAAMERVKNNQPSLYDMSDIK